MEILKGKIYKKTQIPQTQIYTNTPNTNTHKYPKRKYPNTSNVNVNVNENVNENGLKRPGSRGQAQGARLKGSKQQRRQL